jgi:ribose-phosphate pyrophosphokinase
MQRDVVIVPGPASESVAGQIADNLGLAAAEVQSRKFSDGESYVRVLDDLEGKRVVIVQGTHPPQDTHIQQLYQLVDVATSMSARDITCVVPYLAYARQDRRILRGEPVSVSIVLKTLQALGAARLVTIDVHNPAVFGDVDMECVNLSASPCFGEHFSGIGLQDPLVVSPDRGGAGRASAVADCMGAEFGYFEKDKHTDDGVPKYFSGDIRVKDREVIIIDDITSSGSTIRPLLIKLKSEGAGMCYVGITHFFAGDEALARMEGLGAVLVSTDTIVSKRSRISIAPLVSDYITRSICG